MDEREHSDTGTDAPDLDRILAALDASDDGFPEQAILEARAHREAIVPRLIQVLEERTATAREGLPVEGSAAFLAFYLLGEFEARAALPAVLAAMLLPSEPLDELLGDGLTEAGSRVLTVLIGEQFEILDDLIRNRQADESSRWAAASAYIQLVKAGRLTRDEALERLRVLLREAIEQKDAAIVGPLVCEMTNLSPAEALDEIKEAFRRRLVDEFMTNLREVERSLQDRDAWISRELERTPALPIDTLAELRSWHWGPDDKAELGEWDGGAEFDDELEWDEEPLRDDEFLDRPRERVAAPLQSQRPPVGRNDPCPCGSGKKYKKCCGRPE